MKFILYCFYVCIITLHLSNVFARAHCETKLLCKTQQLSQLTTRLKKLQSNLLQVADKREDLSHELKKTEISIGGLAKKLMDIHGKLSKQKNLLMKTQNKLQRYQKKLRKQKSLFIKQVQEAYMFGGKPYLKIILNHQDLEKMNRYLVYYKYFYQARLQLIQKIKKTAKEICISNKKISSQIAVLENIRYQQQHQKNLFNQKKQQRQSIINHMNKMIYSTSKQIMRLKRNKTRIAALIKTLQIQQKSHYSPGAKFSDMRHLFDWPVKNGHIIQYFNQSIVYAHMHATGLLIQAREGEKVRAVFAGKVVFSDWMRGFGLLVIVQHNRDYLTLYGRNQSLYVKNGDAVRPGQIIATIGNSGGFRINALYFETRYKGTPVNPLLLLKQR